MRWTNLWMIFTFLIFWQTPTFRLAMWGVLVLTIVMLLWRYFWQKRKKQQLKKAYFQKMVLQEYQKRLERSSHEIILRILQKEIEKKFMINLQIKHDILEGAWNGQKLAVVYLEANKDEVISERDLLAVLRRCYQEGMSLVRILTNGEFTVDSNNLARRFNCNLRLYNGEKLMYLLKNTLLFPSLTEIKTIIKRGKEQRERRSSLIKKEFLKKNRCLGYLVYSLLLLFMAWNRIGFVYLNLIASLTLGGFALTIIIKYFLTEGEENEQEGNQELYFLKKGF